MSERISRNKKVSRYKTVKTQLTNSETGEVLSETPMLMRNKVNYYKDDYALMFLEAMGKVCEDKILIGEEFRAWVYLVTKMKMQNIVEITQKEIAEALGKAKTHISKYIKCMIAAGVLEKCEKKGKSYKYRIPEHLFWRGTGEEHNRLQTAKILRIDRERLRCLKS